MIDSSTHSCKVVVRESDTGELVRSGGAPHPEGTEVNPQAWWQAVQAAGGLGDVEAVTVGGQQHAMVTKLAWLREHEPEHADRAAAVALPHDCACLVWSSCPCCAYLGHRMALYRCEAHRSLLIRPG